MTPCRIFIVNDQPLARFGLRTMIEQQSGFVCCGEASDLLSAEWLCQQLVETQASLLLTEICLNNGFCFQAIEETRGHLHDLSVLVISRQPESVFAERALRAGAQGFVSALATIETTLQAIQRVNSGEVYLSPNIERQILGRLVGNQQSKHSSCNVYDALTNRELDIFHQLGLGKSSREIASELELSVKTIETYRERIKTKLGLKSTLELSRYAWECQVLGFSEIGQPH